MTAGTFSHTDSSRYPQKKCENWPTCRDCHKTTKGQVGDCSAVCGCSRHLCGFCTNWMW